MTAANVKQKVFAWFYRETFGSEEIIFDDLLLLAARNALGYPQMRAETFVQANHRQYWNWFKENQDDDINRGLHPVFAIKDEFSRRLCWFAGDSGLFSTSKEKFRAILLSARPQILKTVDTLSSREYEALSCFICRILRADHVMLTPPGDERGIDFFACITLPQRSHCLFGGKNPLRIVGQCKKHKDSIQEDTVKEFMTTLDDVKQTHRRIYDLIPTWFKAGKGPILGWIIAHAGFQSGAISRAKEQGIVLSDSRDLTEIIALSKNVGGIEPPSKRGQIVKTQVKQELEIYANFVVFIKS